MNAINDTKAFGVLANVNKRTDPSDSKCVFLVEANPDPDSYTLYGRCSDQRGIARQSVGLALIPTYTDSVRMNLLFRNVRENVSLDYIEESEDEDDFENVSQTKHLLEGASYKMVCSYSKTTNRWIPEEIVSDDVGLSIVPNMTTNGRIGTFVKSSNSPVSPHKYQKRENSRSTKHCNPDTSGYVPTNQKRKPIFSVYKQSRQPSGFKQSYSNM